MSEKTTVTLDEFQEALAKNATLTTENKQLKEQLKDATDALIIIKTKFDAAEKEEKDAVIDELAKDSQGKLTKDALQEHSLKELYFLKDNLDKAEPKTFVSVMHQREKAVAEKKPSGMGSWNPETRKWIGGLPE
jgi:uncharacterized protein YihD (DUF1040 family)